MRSRQQGFTLIELIVVTTIIGVIAAIAIPQYNNYRIKSERAVVISDCNALYRGFVVYFIENSEYPWKDTAGPQQFIPTTLAPLNDPNLMGGMDIGLEMNIKNLLSRVQGNKAEIYDSPDDTLGINQEFFAVFAWGADPTVKFVIAQADDVEYADGTVVDGGNWLDGVYITQGGQTLR